jgi:hypothetical protein
MKTNIYNEEGWVDTWYESINNTVVSKWYKFTTPIHVRKSCEAQMKAVEQYKVKAAIVDSSQAEGVPYLEDQKWFEDVLFPKFQILGVKAVITVLPNNALTRLGVKTWLNTGKKFGMEFIEVATYEDANKYVIGI